MKTIAQQKNIEKTFKWLMDYYTITNNRVMFEKTKQFYIECVIEDLNE